MVKLSLLIVSKNSDELLEKSLQSAIEITTEIIMVDSGSADRTIEIGRKFNAKVYRHKGDDLGVKRAYGLSKARGDWILALDTDEMVSQELKKEIKQILRRNKNSLRYAGFKIPYQNHFLGRRIRHGGENYKKLILFKRDSVKIEPALVHEHFQIKKGKVGLLKGKIYHYSYRSLTQTYLKFTDYARRDARQKIREGEQANLKKIILYPLHMMWSRFIEDKGYKDGVFRIPLDLGFAYMEFLTYLLVLLSSKKTRRKNES